MNERLRADALAAHADAVEPIPETSAAERVVAAVHAIAAPGIARDHGSRLPVLGADRFAGP